MVNFSGDKFHARRKFWALAGKCSVYDQQNNLVCFVKQKMFKLKEDITVYSDEEMQEPVLKIQARQIIDFAAAYDIFDVASGEKLGALKRKGFKSIIKDEWMLMDLNDVEIGTMGEESGIGALLSRFINLIPQKYIVKMKADDSIAARFDQKFSFFTHEFNVNFFNNGEFLDRRLGMGALILLLLIEGRQH